MRRKFLISVFKDKEIKKYIKYNNSNFFCFFYKILNIKDKLK